MFWKESVAAVITHDSSALNYKIGLVHRLRGKGRGLWGFPAGMIEPGETEEQAVLRELMEETGFLGTVLGLRCIVKWDRSMGYIFDVGLGEKRAEGEFPLEFVAESEFLAAASSNPGRKLFKPQVHLAGLYAARKVVNLGQISIPKRRK